MTTRRTFLRLLGIGAPAAAVATQLPEAASATTSGHEPIPAGPAPADPHVVSGFPSGGGQPIPDGPVEIYEAPTFVHTAETDIDGWVTIGRGKPWLD